MAFLLKIVFVVYAIAITYVSLRPQDGIPSVLAHMDKIIHFSMYGGMAFIGLLASTGRTPAWGIVMMTIAFGILQESLQPLFDRSFDSIDIMANSIGALAGYATFKIFRHRLKAITARPE